jgi:hypothetical protein
MAKPLNDILKGSNKSKTISGSLGKDPGVDYEPKAKDEAKFAAKHTRQVHDDRNGNGDDVFKGTTKPAPFPRQKESVYEAKEAEEVTCNHTPKGKHCPMHGMNECWSMKPIKEGENHKPPFSGPYDKKEDQKAKDKNVAKNAARKSMRQMVAKEEVELDEVLTKSTTAGETIHDFVHSKNPKFAGKSKEKRKQMALAAYYAKQRNEETNLGEGHYHVSWGPGVEHSLIAKHAEDAVKKAKDHIIKKTPKLTDPKYADTFAKKPAVHRIKEDLAVPLLGGTDIAKNKTDDTEDEIDMVRTELKALANKATHMLMTMPKNVHIEPWVQAKIAQAKEMIGSVHDYMVYGDHENEDMPDNTGSGGGSAGGSLVMNGTMDTPMTFPNMSVDVNTGQNV